MLIEGKEKRKREFTIIIIIIIIIIISSSSSSSSSSILFLIQSKCLHVLELTAGFESNLNNNAVRKKRISELDKKKMGRNYRCVKFVNLSMSSLGVFCDECSTFLDMMNDIGIDKKQQLYIIKKMINIAIRATYYERLFVNIDQNRLFVAQVQIRISLIFGSSITLNE